MSDDYEAIYSQDSGGLYPGNGYGWIQWKGTKVCMDLMCHCGHAGHVDGDFFYYYRCQACGRLFAVGQNIRLIPLTDEQTKTAETECDLTILTDTI